MNLLLAGRGGQGVVFLSDVLLRSFSASGMRARSCDSVGIAQRGGVVLSQIRWDGTVVSPAIRNASADFAMILDPSVIPDVLRFLNRDSRVFLVSSSADEPILSITRNLVLISPPSSLPLNTFVLGVVFPVFELPKSKVELVLSDFPRTAENIAAFREGAGQA